MLKIGEEYDRDTSLAKLTDISQKVSPCFPYVLLLVFARELW
jgi:hypothetical protein